MTMSRMGQNSLGFDLRHFADVIYPASGGLAPELNRWHQLVTLPERPYAQAEITRLPFLRLGVDRTAAFRTERKDAPVAACGCFHIRFWHARDKSESVTAHSNGHTESGAG